MLACQHQRQRVEAAMESLQTANLLKRAGRFSEALDALSHVGGTSYQ